MTGVKSARFALLLSTLLSLCGCGAKNLHPVRGKVAFADGTPLPGGMIVFYPTDPARQELSRGSIAEDGSFTMGTEAPQDGVPTGTYRVAVLPPAGPLPPPSRDSRSRPTTTKPRSTELIHPRFFDHQTSGLEVTVQPGENHVPIAVSKP